MKKKMGIMSVLLACVLFYLLMVGMLYFKQRQMMYLPPTMAQSDLIALKDFQVKGIPSTDGITLRSYFKAPQKGKPIIIIFHGNASHAAWQVYKIKSLMVDGYGFLLASYRGYDGNEGKPSEAGLIADGKAIVSYICNNFPDHPMILWGESLGTGVAVQVAASDADVHAIILEAPYNSMLAVSEHHYPYIPFMRLILKDQFHSDVFIQKVNRPILFLLAEKDKIVPVALGAKLFQAANEPKTKHVFSGVGHTGVFETNGAEIVQKFLEKLP
jgi:fermentation-respiration switch protein FrsA (DUF1100 family)